MPPFARALTIALPVVAFADAAWAADLQRSIEVDAPVDEVWQKIGQFCAIEAWHPAVSKCTIEDDDMTVYRAFETTDGATFREQLLERTPESYFYSYSIVESPLDVVNYTSRFSIGPGANETSVVVWQAEFSALGVDEDQARKEIAGIYEAGLQGIADMFGE